jgi:hypothetical protein
MPTPYRGVPGVPHVSEEFFAAYFVGAQVSMSCNACTRFISSTYESLLVTAAADICVAMQWGSLVAS